jgi:16S rRNA (cytosine967-C5)-methyltransferase
MPPSTLFQAYVQQALAWLEAYTGDIPLHRYLKNAFRQQSKLGARDRRYISALVYDYFRMGHTLQNRSRLDKMLIGYYLCEDDPLPLIRALKPEWLQVLPDGALPPSFQRTAWFADFRIEELFPWGRQVSEGLDLQAFARSFLAQPHVFIRIRPGHASRVRALRDEATMLGTHTWALPPGVELRELILGEEGKDYFVQDYASQGVMQWLVERLRLAPVEQWKAWDCCAGSGGKSIFLADSLPLSRLMATDIRPTILANLRRRFRQAGISSYIAAAVDVTREQELAHIMGKQTYDLILADVPCSGSGTWARTPEQLYFFAVERLSDFQALQKRLVTQAIRYLHPGGYLAYITCSVFQAENEEVAKAINQLGLTRVGQQLITGYAVSGDSMYIALFRAG